MATHATTLGWLGALCLCTTAAMAQDGTPPAAKQLAGPASEFAAMRAPDPASTAIISKHALLPVAFDAAGEWQGTLHPVAGQLRFALLSGGAAWRAEMRAPDGTPLAAKSLDAGMRAARIGGAGDGQPVRQASLRGLKDGGWMLRLRAPAGSAARGYLLVEGDPRTELASYQTHRRQLVGERIGYTAQLAADDASGTLRMGHAAGRVGQATLRVIAPDGGEQRLPMFDDGRHDDGAAGDGRYGASFVARSAGQHIAQVIVEGRDQRGAPLLRTAEHVVPVIASTLRLASTASATRAEAGRLSIALPLAADDGVRRYRVIGELWGRDGKRAMAPVAWIGGIAESVDGRLVLGMDERWIARAGAQAPFELRQLRVEDADAFIPVATADRLPLAMPTLRVAKAADIAIDELMTMGVRPAALSTQGQLATAGVGRRLVLVHGYCSAGVWPQAQFATSSTFLDANQNRSHDQFAQRIRTFGAQWNSFGTVAHSQGGAASLHLYTYYWSGLDNATGGRRMQSVGTPYQGTNLSGILATVGNWFGVACGSNANMTYSGASAWLAGIPTSARAQVNYYSTSFRSTNWWTNDYCNFASDLVLGDPEDGTVERAYAQLPGAVNRGHVTGQCHTAGMRDPAQYNDAARNATMSANASR